MNQKMFNFEYFNPTRIIFGEDGINKLDKLVPQDANILIVYGRSSIKKYGTLDKVKQALGGRNVFEFGGIEPNPPYETLLNAIKLVKNENINFLLAIGGGSIIDGTKFISAATFYEGEPLEILESGSKGPQKLEKTIPFGTILTLPAAGSEMNCVSVVTQKEIKCKFRFFSESLFPKFSILDPTLTYTLPTNQVANGVVDTFVHVIEQYLTYPVDARIQDRYAESIMQTLIEIGKETIDNPTDYSLRANLMWSATSAQNGMIGVGVPQDWSSHKIGYELTSLFGLDHAQTLAVILPSLMNLRKEQKRLKLLQYAKRVWNITDEDEDLIINKAIDKTRNFFEELGVKTHLSDYGIKADDIDFIIEKLTKHGAVALSERQDLTPEISKKILQNAL